MANGYMGQVLHVDLGTEKTEIKPLDDEVRQYIGGKGYSARMLYDMTEPGIDALGPDNPLIFGTGPYNGTYGVQSTRFSVAAKSPLTGTIGNATCGGDFANTMKKAGYDFIVIKGQAKKPVYLDVNEEGATIQPADQYWGMTTGEVQKQFPKGTHSAVIGPAGENQVLYASIISGRRAAGRSGLGAVMGSKMLKAVVCKGKKKVEVARRDKFKNLNKWMINYYKNHSVNGGILPSMGTANLLMTTAGKNIMPTFNFQKGSHKLAWKISGELMRDEYLEGREGCTSCPIRCGRKLKSSAPGSSVKGPEYETLALNGSNLGIFDLEAVLKQNELLDELGMDSISAGGTLAYAMEANEKGLWNNGLKFGDTAAVEKALEDIAYRRGLGDELANGSYRLAKKYGGEEFAIHVKGMEMAGYDPRGCYGQGLEYATTNRGGCHINGAVMALEATGLLSVDPLSIGAKPELVIFQQNLMAAINAMIICTFSAYAVVPSIAGALDPQGALYNGLTTIVKNSGPVLQLVLKMKPFLPVLWYEKYLAYVTGESYSLGRLTESGERNFNMERLFNVREGFSFKEDTLPGRILDEPLFDEQEKGVPLGDMLPKYYKTRGWSPDGIPTDRTLDRLQIRR